MGGRTGVTGCLPLLPLPPPLAPRGGPLAVSPCPHPTPTPARGPILGTPPLSPPKPGEGCAGTRANTFIGHGIGGHCPVRGVGGTSGGARETQAGLAWGVRGAPPFWGAGAPGSHPLQGQGSARGCGLQGWSGGSWGVPRGLTHPRHPPGGGTCSPGDSCLAMHMPRGAGRGGRGRREMGLCLVLPFLGAHGCHCHCPSVLRCLVGLVPCSLWPSCPHLPETCPCGAVVTSAGASSDAQSSVVGPPKTRDTVVGVP